MHLRETLSSANGILVYYDDDADGLASFLLVKHAFPEAIGIRAARGPELGEEFLRYEQTYKPSIILILDKPAVSDAFFEGTKTPIIWIDHHSGEDPQRSTVTYINHCKEGRDEPTSYWIYKEIGGPLWLAAAGCISDWHSCLLAELQQNQSDLAPQTVQITDALYHAPIGKIIRILNFSMKGTSKDIRQTVHALARIRDPQELLQPTTFEAKTVYKHTKKLIETYEKQLQQASQARIEEGILVHYFKHEQQSFVADIANELLATSEAEIIIIARGDERRTNISLRSKEKVLPDAVQQALSGLDGYGGGHDVACGASIHTEDWEIFLHRLLPLLKT